MYWKVGSMARGKEARVVGGAAHLHCVVVVVVAVVVVDDTVVVVVVVVPDVVVNVVIANLQFASSS